MYTYTFPHEHFKSIMDHMTGLQIVVDNLSLNETTYTMTCTSQVDADQYQHLNELFGLVEVI